MFNGQHCRVSPFGLKQQRLCCRKLMMQTLLLLLFAIDCVQLSISLTCLSLLAFFVVIYSSKFTVQLCTIVVFPM